MQESTKGPKTKTGRPLKGNERTISKSIRVEPSKLAFIEAKHGKFQKWLDAKLEEETGGVHEAVIVRRKRTKPEVVTVDDF